MPAAPACGRCALRKALAAIVAAAALPGCGGAQKPAAEQPTTAGETGVVRVEAREYTYLMPERVKGGVVSLEFINGGLELHEFALARLAPGATFEEFRRELTDGDDEAPGAELARDVGGVPVLSPGQRATVTRRLAPGTYVLVDYVPAPDGRPHVEHGMIRSFTVADDSGRQLPRPNAVIVAGEKSFRVPALHAGRQTIELRNEASEEREFQLTGLKPGKTRKDAEAWFKSGLQGPAPVVFPGGMQSIPPRTSVFEEIELDQGVTYFLEDEHGLKATFMVS